MPEFTLRLDSTDHKNLIDLAKNNSKTMVDYLRGLIRKEYLLTKRLELIKEIQETKKSA